jgi:hypothetical protein
MTDYVDTQGTDLKIGNGASPEVFTSIPQIVSIDGPSSARSEKTVTHLKSTAVETSPMPPWGGWKRAARVMRSAASSGAQVSGAVEDAALPVRGLKGTFRRSAPVRLHATQAGFAAYGFKHSGT